MSWLHSIIELMDRNLSQLWETVGAWEPGVLQSMGRKRVGHDWRTEQQQRQVSFGIISLWILSHSQSETVLLNWKMWLNYHTYTHSIYVTRPKSQHNPLKIQKAFLKVLSLCMLLLLLLSCFNHVWLCATPETAAHEAPLPGILQARTLEWVAISFSKAWKWKVKVKSLSRVRLFATPWTVAFQVPPPMGFSRQEYWNGVPLPSPCVSLMCKNSRAMKKVIIA